MSKQVRKKVNPAPASASSSDDDELPPTTDPVGVVEESPAEATTGTGVEDVGAVAGPSTSSDADQRWQAMAVQLEALKDVLAHLCHLVAPGTMDDAIGAPRAATLPVLPPPLPTRQEAAILRAPWRQTAILATPRADTILNLPSQPPPLEDGGKRSRSRHLTTVKEFSVGGDWSAFACRFLAAVRTARWTDAEALEVLPTLLDDESVRFFRSITTDKKATVVFFKKWPMLMSHQMMRIGDSLNDNEHQRSRPWRSGAVYVPDDRGPQQLTAASAPWTGRGGPRPRAALPERGRQEARPALRRNEAECFRCGRRGHYARDCWARFPAPPQQEASAPVKQAGRDIAGDEGPCSEDACQVCGTFEPCSPSDPAAGTVTGQAQD
ncbi:unnamed protein product [Lampetra planeri]